MNKQLLIIIGGIALLGMITMMISTQKCTRFGTLPDNTDALKAYKIWKKQQGLKYGSPEEDAYRQSVFVDNYTIIIAHNSNISSTYQMGLNAFSALTQEEFKSIYLMNNIPIERHSTIFEPKLTAPIAASLNWADLNVLPPVKNQGQCGSCWAFSTVAVLESTNAIFNKVPVVSFAEQQLVDCCGSNGFGCSGCNGAWPTDAFRYAQTFGIVQETSYPYTALDGTCKSDLKTVFTPSGQASVTNSVQGFLDALNVQPISISIDATSWNYYSSGVFNECSDSPYAADHAVTLTGYDADGNWIVRNSWGPSWGQNGYIILASGNTCGILNYGLVATA